MATTTTACSFTIGTFARDPQVGHDRVLTHDRDQDHVHDEDDDYDHDQNILTSTTTSASTTATTITATTLADGAKETMHKYVSPLVWKTANSKYVHIVR